MLGSVVLYLFMHEEAAATFSRLGFPIFIIYPLAIAKLLGLFAIWNPNFNSLKEWAYAGFFFNFILATTAHFVVPDGEQVIAIVAIILLLVSYFSAKKLTT